MTRHLLVEDDASEENRSSEVTLSLSKNKLNKRKHGSSWPARANSVIVLPIPTVHLDGQKGSTCAKKGQRKRAQICVSRVHRGAVQWGSFMMVFFPQNRVVKKTKGSGLSKDELEKNNFETFV